MPKVILLGALLVAAGAGAPSAWPAPQDAAAPAPALVADADREAFLLEAQIVKTRSAPGGITGSTRATLRRGDIVHDAHIQTIDQRKAVSELSTGVEVDFRDSWRNNVAAYRLDRMLGLGMVPVTVVRSSDGKPAAFTWWVDDVIMDEKQHYQKKISTPDVEAWNCQMFVVRVFDQLIYNTDRNLGNLLIDKEWRMWMIDHTRAFKIFKDVKAEKNLGTRCERNLLAALRRLDKPTVQASMKDLLDPGQIDGLLGRRDGIVQYYDDKVRTLGEEAVLYELPSRVSVTAAPR